MRKHFHIISIIGRERKIQAPPPSVASLRAGDFFRALLASIRVQVKIKL